MTTHLDTIETQIEYGPFQTTHHQSLVNDKFKQAFRVWICDRILPRLSGKATLIKGWIRTNYDHQKFFGPRSVVKYRYQASLWCEVTDGKEEVVATLDYDSDRTIFVERKDRCHVYTIAQQKDHQLLDRQIADVKDEYARGQREFWCPRCQSAVKVSAEK